MTSLTRDEAMVLFQVQAGISDPEDIADILPEQELKDVQAAMHGLRDKGLIRTEKKRLRLTHNGEEALRAHRRTAIGL